MAVDSGVMDVTDETFEAEVIERSKSRPVVVDFWAPWCGPCRLLGPIIERVAAESGGAVALVKLNTDENPRTAQSYRIEGIPAVKAFRDGHVVAEFTGAIPETQVRAFFQKLTPSAAERVAQQADEAARAGDTGLAEAHYRVALESAPNNVDAIVGLANLLLARGDRTEAEALLGRAPTDRRAKVMKHRLFLDDFAQKHGDEDLAGEMTANPADPRARYRLGVLLAARQDYDGAIDQLLESLRLDRKFADGAARKAVLAVFDIVGLDSPQTREYQRRLSNVLF